MTEASVRRHDHLHPSLVPISLKIANAYIAEQHRHHPPVAACVSVVGVKEGERLCGVGDYRPTCRSDA